MYTLRGKVVQQLNSCLQAFRTLKWNTLDLPEAFMDIEDELIPFNIEKLTQVVELNCAVRGQKRDMKEKQRECRVTYEAFLNMEKADQKVDRSINGVTYDVVALDKNKKSHKVEWKNPYKMSEDEIKGMPEHYWFQTSSNYPGAILRVMPMCNSLMNMMELWWGVTLNPELKEEIRGLITIARDYRSEHESVEMTEDDITTDFMMKLMSESGSLYSSLNYKKDYASLSDGSKETVVRNILKNIKPMFEFAKQNAEDPITVGRWIPENPNGTSSFDREDDPVNHARMPRLIATLPDREFVPLEQWEEEGYRVTKFFDTFTTVNASGVEREIVYEKGSQVTLLSLIKNLDKVEQHKIALREYNLIYALNSTLKRAEHEGIGEALEDFRMSTQLEGEAAEELIGLLMHPKANQETRIEIMNSYLKGLGDVLTMETNGEIKVDGAGEMLLNDATRKMDHKRKNQTADSKKKPETLVKDYEAEMKEQISGQSHDQGVDMEWNLNLRDAYSEKTLRKISNLLVDSSKARLEQISNSRYYGVIFQQFMFLKQILADGNSGTSKSANGFRIIYHRDRGFYTLKTNDTSKITTGTMWNFGCFEKNYEGENTFPAIYGDYYYIETESRVYFVSKPYTMSIPVLERPFFQISSWIATMLTMTEEMSTEKREDFLNSNLLLHSLFWDYNANIRHALTTVNFLYKLPLASGFFGKFEMKGRFDKYVIKDCRMATIYHRIKRNWAPFVQQIRDKKAEMIAMGVKQITISKILKGIRDPIFGFRHRSALTLNNIGFLKNILLKDDGVDEEKFLASQYKTESQHYTEDYLQSKVVEMWDKYKSDKIGFEDFDEQFKRFNECLFAGSSEEAPKWAAVSFYPEIIDIMANDLYSEIEENHPKVKQDVRRWVNETSMASEKQSKVNLFDSAKTEELMQDYLKLRNIREADMKDEDFVEYCAKKGFLVGIRSFDLPTAMKIEIKKMADYLRKVSSPERPFYMFNKGPKLLHLAMFGLLKYGKSCIVTQHMKKQVGDLRIFFMQELSMRNGNRVIDKVHSALLSKVKEDLIMKRGDRKLMCIENMSNIIKVLDALPMTISCDQKRYGDTYPLETLYIKINILFEKEWISRDEYMIFKKCLDLIRNRYVLLSPKVRAFLKKIDTKEIDPLVTLSQNSREIASDLKVIFGDKMKPEDFVSYKDEDLIELISKNKGLKKGVGWILGVMNMFSSVDTSLHLKTVIECIKFLILGDPVLTGGTHSDDEIIITGIRSISCDELTERLGKNKLMNDLPSIVEKGEKFTIDKNGLSSTSSKRSYEIGDLSALILTLSLYTPRFFGQRPSLAKWVWGDSGEVLQTTVQNGSSTQPISKWLTVFARELPFVSPGADLQHMIAQIIPSLKHGASEELMACGFYLVNKVLSWIYPDVERDVRYPPELGGFWWCIPSLIKESGFAANELRLYTLSDVSKRIIKIMSKTSKLWNFNKINQESKEYEVHSRVDLQLVFSVYTSTDKNIQELIRRLNLEEKLEEMGFNSFYSNLKAFAAEGKATRLKQGKTVENNTVSYLTRMYSPSYQRRMFKTKASKALIATLGYANRRFKNLFKEEYNSKALITFTEWKSIILSESLEDEDEKDKAINLFEKVYQSDLIYHRRFMIPEDFTVKKYKKTQCGSLFDLKYKEVKTSREGYYPEFGKAVILACYDLMSDIAPESEELIERIRKTETYLYNQEVCEDDGFETAVRTWLDNFRKLGLKRNDLIEVYDFLVGVLSSTYALDILKRKDKDSHVLVDSFRNMWSSNEYLNFKVDKFTSVMLENEEISKEKNVREIISSKNAKDLVSEMKDADRILSINGWVKEIYDLKTKDVIIKVGQSLEIGERYLTEKYRDLEISDLGEGFFDRDRTKDKFKNKLLLRELSLFSQGKLEEGHGLKFYRGVVHRVRKVKERHYEREYIDNKYNVFSMSYDNKYVVQVVYENYREEIEKNKAMKAWLFFANTRNPNSMVVQSDMHKLGPLLEFMNYFLISSIQAKLEVSSPKFVFNEDWNLAGGGLKAYKWPEGFEFQQNSDLKHLNVHFGTLFPLDYLQEGEMSQNGISFRPLRVLIRIENDKVDWVDTERPVLANYLITPWLHNSSELNFSIFRKDFEGETLIYKDTNTKTKFGEPNEELMSEIKQKYGFLFRVHEMPTEVMLNMISIVDSYICNVETLRVMRENSSTNQEFICEFGSLEWSSFIKRITNLASKALEVEHTDSNSYRIYEEGVRIMNTYRVMLGELAIPSVEEVKSLRKEDREILENYLSQTYVNISDKSDLMLIAQNEVARGSDLYFLDEGTYKKDPEPMLWKLKPKVSLMDTRTYLKYLYEPVIGVPEVDDDYHKRVFQMLNTRGNLPISLLSDILIGTKAENKSALILKMISSGRGTNWCRTKMRVSRVILQIIKGLLERNEGVGKIIKLIEVLEY